MATIPAKVHDRLIAGMKKFQPILSSLKAKDINESDTVGVIIDMLNEVFGYVKYDEITTEYVIAKTYCDLAIKINGKIKYLIEAKAIGMNLKEDHIRQAVDYGAKEGVEWVILTTGILWQIYNIGFSKPITKELVYEFDFTQLSSKKESDVEILYYVSKESIAKSALEDYHQQRQALSKYFIGQMLLTDTLLDVINRELRRVSPGVKIDNQEIASVLKDELIKREVLEGDKAEEAKKRIKKAQNVTLRSTKKGASGEVAEITDVQRSSTEETETEVTESNGEGESAAQSN